METREIRFATLGALSEAFERLCGRDGTELCLARPSTLTLQIRSRDARALARLDGLRPVLAAVPFPFRTGPQRSSDVA